MGGTRHLTGADGGAYERPTRDGRTTVRALAGALMTFGCASAPAVWRWSAGNSVDPSWAMTSSLSMLKIGLASFLALRLSMRNG